MKFTIRRFDPTTGTVPVTFEHLGVRHRRAVNACLAEDGAFDAMATKARVEEVALGVAHKIELGVITGPAPG